MDTRDELASLGRRRARNEAEREAMMDEMKRAVQKARNERIPMSEIASLTGIHRTTLYRVYDEPE